MHHLTCTVMQKLSAIYSSKIDCSKRLLLLDAAVSSTMYDVSASDCSAVDVNVASAAVQLQQCAHINSAVMLADDLA